MSTRQMTREEAVSAWELRKHLMRRSRKLRSIYRTLIILVIIVFLGICAHVIFYYNYLTDLRFNVLTAQGKVAGAIQYRTNLLPVLVESVISFVEHEDNVFNRTVDARERELTQGRKLTDELRKMLQRRGKAGKASTVQSAFDRIMAIAEQYPQLKTSETFQLLMNKVGDAETKILTERMSYNEHVNAYTTALSMFPGNVYAYLFGFPTYEYFKERQQSEWPEVRLSRWQRTSGTSTKSAKQ